MDRRKLKNVTKSLHGVDSASSKASSAGSQASTTYSKASTLKAKGSSLQLPGASSRAGSVISEAGSTYSKASTLTAKGATSRDSAASLNFGNKRKLEETEPNRNNEKEDLTTPNAKKQCHDDTRLSQLNPVASSTPAVKNLGQFARHTSEEDSLDEAENLRKDREKSPVLSNSKTSHSDKLAKAAKEAAAKKTQISHKSTLDQLLFRKWYILENCHVCIFQAHRQSKAQKPLHLNSQVENNRAHRTRSHKIRVTG